MIRSSKKTPIWSFFVTSVLAKWQFHYTNTGIDSPVPILVESTSKENFHPLELTQGRIQKIQIEGGEEIAADHKPPPPRPKKYQVRRK